MGHCACTSPTSSCHSLLLYGQSGPTHATATFHAHPGCLAFSWAGQATMGRGLHTSRPSWTAGAGGLPLEEDEGDGGALAGAGACCMGGGGGAYDWGENC